MGERIDSCFRWLGSEEPCLDQPLVDVCGEIAIARYGGNTLAGACRNEDGAVAWDGADGSWRFAILLDAHASAESAKLVLSTVDAAHERIASILSHSAGEALPELREFVIALFASDSFRERCQQVRGETACLICAQKEQFLFWLSIGDCMLYVLHSELMALGQIALTQRNFFEWVGKVNSFELAVSCHSSGVRELRGGENIIVMATDGLLECGARPFEDGRCLYEAFTRKNDDGIVCLRSNVLSVLERVHEVRGRDSATVVCWRYAGKHACAYPSA